MRQCLLKRLRLPPGALHVRIGPAGDHRSLGVAGDLNGDGAHATADAWWTIGAPAEVLAYVSGHRPTGSTANGTGSTADSRTGTSSNLLGFDWPSLDSNVLGDRQLQVTMPLGHGETGIMAEAIDWVVLRAWVRESRPGSRR